MVNLINVYSVQTVFETLSSATATTGKVLSDPSPPRNLRSILVTCIGKKICITYVLRDTSLCREVETNFGRHWNFSGWGQKLAGGLEG